MQRQAATLPNGRMSIDAHRFLQVGERRVHSQSHTKNMIRRLVSKYFWPPCDCPLFQEKCASRGKSA